MGCSSSLNPSQVIAPRVPLEQSEKSDQVKSFAEVSTQTDVIQMADIRIGATHSDKETDDRNSKVDPKNTEQKDSGSNVFLNSRLDANPRRGKFEWNLFGLDAVNFTSIIQRELSSISPTAIQAALQAMKKAVELQNLTQDVWNLLEKAGETNDVKYFILAYTHASGFYEILNRKLTERGAQKTTETDIDDQFESVIGNLFQNLNFAVNSLQAMQAGQTVPIQGADETDWAALYLRPLYRLLLVPNPKIRFHGQTYRGMWISRDEFQRYTDAEFVCYKAVTSTSALRQVAQGFINRVEVSSANMISVIFIYDINPMSSLFALKIREYSKFPEEEEVLILPGLFFKVININIISAQAAEIELRIALDDAQAMFMDGLKSLVSLD